MLEDSADADMRDRRFIAHAREDIPALLAEVRALREVAEAARELPDGGAALVEVVYGEGPTALMAAALRG